MLLKKLSLSNLRSYLHEEINFSDGSILLSGEAGSGKSTLLLAIEFALFGLGKGKEGITAEALLRRGKNEGNVELLFEIDGKEVKIKRTLKRKSKGFEQEKGEIAIAGITEQLTPQELRSRVLQLFNYPKEFVEKGKGLPFHYTVYTKQEEMKSIMLEGIDVRLDTLRRIFGIDKYKTIKENLKLFSTAIHDKIKEKEGAVLDLQEKQVQLKKQEESASQQEAELKKLMPSVEKIKMEVKGKKDEILELENKIQLLRKLEEQMIRKKAELSSSETMLKNALDSENLLNLEIEKLRTETKKFSNEELSNLKARLSEISKKLEENEAETRKLVSEASKIEANKEKAQQLLEKIRKVKICPECGQEVTEQHRTEIEEKCKNELLIFNKHLTEFSQLKEGKENEKAELKKEENALENKERLFTELQIKLDSLKEKEEKLKKLSADMKELERKISSAKEEIRKFDEELKKSADLEKTYAAKKNEFDYLKDKEKEFEIIKARIENTIANISSQVSELKKEIEKKEKIKADVYYLKGLREWLHNDFDEIVSKIEQSVFAALHSDFDILLKKWFSMLVEEPEMLVRLDADFSPIVEQAGYDTEYAHLSGGERTAIALAYRLALNQVVNKLITQIKTRDLLILDEPTEGFSHSQLDKMRDVLKELNLRQLIIISHNPKIEGFVDKVIRVRKEGHVSRVVG